MVNVIIETCNRKKIIVTKQIYIIGIITKHVFYTYVYIYIYRERERERPLYS